MFANTSLSGMSFAFPDVCLTPTPAGPVPIPYPNIAQNPIGVPPVVHIIYCGAPVHNMNTIVPLSSGDEPGVATGVASGTVMGPRRHITAAFTCIVGGAPITRLTSMTMQNSTNIVGAQITPSQTKVLILAP